MNHNFTIHLSIQNVSGVFVCLVESLLKLLTVNERLLSIYYLIFVLAAYLAAFDLHYALPCSVSKIKHMIYKIHCHVIFYRTITSCTLTDAVNPSLRSLSTMFVSILFFSYHP